MNRFFYLFIVTVLGISCADKTPPKTDVIIAMQSLQNLATVEYSITKVVKANDNIEWYKPGERKILITCKASVKAGVNLENIKAEDVEVNGKSIRIKLPPPEILTINLPPDNIKVAYSEVGFFRDQFSSAEKDALLSQAENQIRNSGEALGIIEQSKLNTQTFLSNLLKQMGFERISLIFDDRSRVILNNNQPD